MSSTRHSLGRSSAATDGGGASGEATGDETTSALDGPVSFVIRTAPNTVSPTSRLMIAAVSSVPGSPASWIR